MVEALVRFSGQGRWNPLLWLVLPLGPSSPRSLRHPVGERHFSLQILRFLHGFAGEEAPQEDEQAQVSQAHQGESPQAEAVGPLQPHRARCGVPQDRSTTSDAVVDGLVVRIQLVEWYEQ